MLTAILFVNALYFIAMHTIVTTVLLPNSDDFILQSTTLPSRKLYELNIHISIQVKLVFVLKSSP